MDVLPADPTVPGYYLRADYYDLLADLRRDAPVHEFAPGMRTIARYDDIREISRDPARFCSSMGALVNDPMRTWERPAKAASILHMDPPDHVGFRKLVNREFTPRAIANLEPRIRELARTVLDRTPDYRRVRLRRPRGRAVPADGDRGAARDPRRRPTRLPALVRRDDRGHRQAARGDRGGDRRALRVSDGAHRGEEGESRRRRRVAPRRRGGRRPFARPRRAADLPARAPRRRQRDDAHVDLRRNARAVRARRPTRRPGRRSDARSRARSRSACAGSRRSRRSPAP